MITLPRDCILQIISHVCKFTDSSPNNAVLALLLTSKLIHELTKHAIKNWLDVTDVAIHAIRENKINLLQYAASIERPSIPKGQSLSNYKLTRLLTTHGNAEIMSLMRIAKWFQFDTEVIVFAIYGNNSLFDEIVKDAYTLKQTHTSNPTPEISRKLCSLDYEVRYIGVLGTHPNPTQVYLSNYEKLCKLLDTISENKRDVFQTALNSVCAADHSSSLTGYITILCQYTPVISKNIVDVTENLSVESLRLLLERLSCEEGGKVPNDLLCKLYRKNPTPAVLEITRLILENPCVCKSVDSKLLINIASWDSQNVNDELLLSNLFIGWYTDPRIPDSEMKRRNYAIAMENAVDNNHVQIVTSMFCSHKDTFTEEVVMGIASKACANDMDDLVELVTAEMQESTCSTVLYHAIENVFDVSYPHINLQ